MRPLYLDSEPYQPRGNITGEGVSKVLGTPSLGRLQVLVRETVQNTWDAWDRDRQEYPIYGMSLRRLSRSEHRFLARDVFGNRPASPAARRELGASLDGEPPWVLEIYDKGTTGLGGPTRADQPHATGEPTDFVDFVRNVGSPRDKSHGGGTYGYGKSCVYLASRCHTVCVSTLCHSGSRLLRRFIACRMGRRFEITTTKRRRRFTGRHWWGVEGPDRVADPVEGNAATVISDRLGMERRSAGDTGTSILILDPEFEERSSIQIMNLFQETLLWYFWPKMIEVGSRSPAMYFELFLEGRQIPIRAPEQCPPLRSCLEAMRAIKKENRRGRVSIGCERPRQHLGWLAVDTSAVQPRIELDTGDEDLTIPKLSHHVALMRSVELVVTYLEGPQHPIDGLEYGGVFIADREVDEAFARAEPPAHDDWNPNYLPKGPDKTFVRVALRRILDRVRELVVAPHMPTAPDQTLPVAAIADALGQLFPGAKGPALGGEAAAPRPQATSSSRRHLRSAVSGPVPRELEVVEGVLLRYFESRFSPGQDGSQWLIKGSPEVMMDGGTSTREPAGVQPPRIRSWRLPSRTVVSDVDEVKVTSGDAGAIRVAVEVPSDCAVGLQLSVNPVPSNEP